MRQAELAAQRLAQRVLRRRSPRCSSPARPSGSSRPCRERASASEPSRTQRTSDLPASRVDSRPMASPIGVRAVTTSAGDRLGEGVDAGVRGQLRRQPVRQHRIDQRVLGPQQRAGDAGLDVGRLVGDHRAARHLRAGAGRGRDAHQRYAPAARTPRRRRRTAGTGRPGRRPGGPPWRCPSTSRRRSRRRRRPRTRPAPRRRCSTSPTVGSPGAFSNRDRAGHGVQRGGDGRDEAVQALVMITNGRTAPSSASTSASSPATPSPKRILTGRWLRKGAIIARPFSSGGCRGGGRHGRVAYRPSLRTAGDASHVR